eukprot:EG_transcript_2013
MPAQVPAHPAIPVATVAPRDIDLSAAACVTGTVVVDQHAKDMEAVHSYFRHRVALLQGNNYAQVIRHVGDGTWSAVYHVLEEERARFATLKVVPVGAANADSAHAEVETLRRLQHPNVVRCHGSFVRNINDTKCLFVQLELCEKGTLLDYLRTKQPRPAQFTAEMVVTFASQLAAALKYIHAQGLLHGDLRPENILLTKEKCLKLSSFGSPLWIERHGRVDRTITGGDRVYAPPEWAESAVPHRRLQPWETPLSSYDMWSLGCVVTELVTLKLLRQDRHCTAAIGGNPDKLQAIMDEVAVAHAGLFAPLSAALLNCDATERATAGEAGRLLLDLSKSCPRTPRGTCRWLLLPNFFWKCACPPVPAPAVSA